MSTVRKVRQLHVRTYSTYVRNETMFCGFTCFILSLLLVLVIVYGEFDRSRSYYEVLGIPEGIADIKLIKKAYRALAIKVTVNEKYIYYTVYDM